MVQNAVTGFTGQVQIKRDGDDITIRFIGPRASMARWYMTMRMWLGSHSLRPAPDVEKPPWTTKSWHEHEEKWYIVDTSNAENNVEFIMNALIDRFKFEVFEGGDAVGGHIEKGKNFQIQTGFDAEWTVPVHTTLNPFLHDDIVAGRVALENVPKYNMKRHFWEFDWEESEENEDEWDDARNWPDAPNAGIDDSWDGP